MNFNQILDNKLYPLDLLNLTSAEQIKTLIEQPDAVKIIRSLPSQHIALIIKEVGISDCLEVLELLSTDQVKGIFDLEIWKKDRIDVTNLLPWIDAFISADPKLAIKHFHNLDLELISLFFKLHSVIYDFSEESELPDFPKIYFISPDQKYIIFFYGEKKESFLLFLRYYVDELYRRDARFISQLLEAIQWELVSSLEEKSYITKNFRLSDMGFHYFNESISMFAYINPNKLFINLKEIEKIKRQFIVAKNKYFLPQTFFFTSFDKYEILKKSLIYLSVIEKKKLLYEIYSTINNVQIALGESPLDNKALKRSSHFVLSSINIALCYFSKNNEKTSACYLKTYKGKKLFKAGYSICLQPRKYWFLLQRNNCEIFNKNAINYLDFPLCDVVLGAISNKPVFFEGLFDYRKNNFDIFENLDEVIFTTQAVTEAAFRLYFIGKAFKQKFNNIKGSCAQTFATYLCWHLLNKSSSCNPFNQENLNNLFKRLVASDDGLVFSIEDKFKAELLGIDLVNSVFPIPGVNNLDQAIKKIKNYTQIVLQSIETEFSKITNTSIDIRFVNSILTNL